jgi:polyisoprenoid-binding protein YceI
MATAAPQRFAGVYEIDRAHSTAQFAITHVGISTFRASFTDVDALLAVEGDAVVLEGSTRVESVSIVDPPEFRDHVVGGADFFAADAYPTISFRSTSVELGDDGGAAVAGELVIRGVSRPVTARGTFRPPIEDPFGAHRAGLELTATIDRRDFGLSWQMPLPDGGDALGWDVEITAHLELVRRD